MTQPETARELLHRHGLPEDIIDGALCLHAQELAAVQRAALAKTDDPVFYEGEAGWLINLIEPTRTPAAVSAAVAPPTNQTALRDRIAQAIEDAPFRPDERRSLQLADAVLAVLPEPADRAALDAARATNQRLNREKQRLESELATYRKAVTQWEISEHSTYVPLRSLAAIAKAAGVDVPDRWEAHYERVERAEAELRRMADETATETHAVTTVPCSGTLGTQHQPHNWEPQPGMDPVHCPGTRKPPMDPVHILGIEAADEPAAGARQDEPPQPSLRDQHRAAWHALTPDQQAARIAELDAIDEPAGGARQDGAET